MRGRGKFEAERLVLSAHTREALARTKRLRPAEFYLRPPKQPSKPAPSAVASMMQKAERSGLAVRVRRIPAKERKALMDGRSNPRIP